MLEKLNSFIWGTGLITLILLTGAIFTVKTKFVQLRMFPFIFHKLRQSKSKRSQFRVFCMSLGTAMGTGNITGVASAIKLGGAGAIFWMWISAFTGMSIVYAENNLSAKYSRKGIFGPMAYIQFGVRSRPLSLLFGLFCILSSLGMGGMVQINEMTNNIEKCASIPSPFIFVGLFMVIYITIRGGSSTISCVAQILLPLSTIIYSLLCIIVIISSDISINDLLNRIFTEAFGIKQVLGGVSGYSLSRTVSVGIRRGIFSNEAGLGSSPILHISPENYGSAETQGVCSMFEVFIDTFLCCTLTAVTLLCTGSQTVNQSFSYLIGGYADIILAVLMSVFAFCTVIGWSYCGQIAFKYVFNRNSLIFCFIYSVVSSMGTLIKNDEIWTLSDIFNGLMAFINIFALLFLIKDIKKEY